MTMPAERMTGANPGAGGSARDAALGVVRQGLAQVAERLEAEGLESPPLAGSLIRPLVAYAGAAGLGPRLTERFWAAAAAVQLAHEASLVHDDVVDGAALRRGVPTEAARVGVARALIRGDHLLTWGYRAAAETVSPGFMRAYAAAVERTVAGEMAQARRGASPVDMEAYTRTISDKSGALLGCALAAGPILWGDRRVDAFLALGRRLGVLYQMLDDLLDYCPGAGTGKPAYGDYGSSLWTWPLLEAPGLPFGLDVAELRRRLATDGRRPAPLRRCAERFRGACDAFASDARALLPRDEILADLVAEWRARAATGVARELADSRAAAPPVRAPVAARAQAAARVQLRCAWPSPRPMPPPRRCPQWRRPPAVGLPRACPRPRPWRSCPGTAGPSASPSASSRLRSAAGSRTSTRTAAAPTTSWTGKGRIVRSGRATRTTPGPASTRGRRRPGRHTKAVGPASPWWTG